ncbi:interleukin-2 receptor subunit beta isoform 2-T2 [Clarias gariepinus]|uniref:interleukin-2 receptor subunit beta isoform X2 n=1 Tax=Clarias gariepinus TaxID=13013 RepID=UPI00234D9FB1|nr:interleukin-2 receptor subunit beta isoform X2 [Clarias gariepinus]
MHLQRTVMLGVLLFLFLQLPGDAQATLSHPGLSCVSDYVNNISCVWNHPAWVSGQKCQLHLNTGRTILNCSLNIKRSCWVTIPFKLSFASRFDLNVICNQTVMDGVRAFQPGRNVKLHPPDQPRVSGDNVTWSRGAHFPNFIKSYEFQLQVKSKKETWEEVSLRRVFGTFALLDGHVCEEDCAARVRVKPVEPQTEGQIRGQWSDWSPVVTWRSKVIRNPNESHMEDMGSISNPAGIGLLVGFAALIFILLVLTLLSVYRQKCGLKVSCEHIPDPSKYFQPLIMQHKGNFQEWVGPQHSAPVFLAPQSCDCEISPIDEVCEAWDDPLSAKTMLIYANHGEILHQQMSDDSQLSSGVSNMGYFYSEHQPGSVCLDSCPVYFTYHPEGGPIQSSMTYERLQGIAPMSPDSGFGMEVEKEETGVEEQLDNTDQGHKTECSGANLNHLVSFVLSLPESTRITTPPSFAELTPWNEESESSGISMNSQSLDDAVVRPSSMVVQPCTSGYLTLKEMQKYSNKSI